MIDSVPRRLRHALPKLLLIDLEDRLRAEAVKANEMVRDHSGLDTKRARELVGQARFRMMEKGFEEVCTLHEGKLLDGGVIPKTELKVFQPFMRFEFGGEGVILGLAAMPEPRAIPHKNKSRLAGVSLNYHLSPRLDLDGTGPKVGDIFTLFLCSRDRQQAGQIEEVAIGVVNSTYEAFLFYEPLEKFLSGYADAPADVSAPIAALEPTVVTLKKKITPFVPPEAPKPEEQEEKPG
jgi:hypothetical protein